jgi:dTDP-4-amino-4,6-dideoxygalactose transaminase
MRIPLLKVFMAPDASSAVEQVLYSGYVGQGPQVEAFESALESYLNRPHILTLNSGTSALQLALHLTKGQAIEVLTTPLTCFATTAAILNNGLKPRWVDVDLATCNMSMDDLARKLDRNSSLLMLVHFAGNPIDYNHLGAILDDQEAKYGKKITVIEDCAHALGSEYRGSRLGSHQYISCYSFQAVKTLNTADGGAIAFHNQELYERAKRLRWFGLDRSKDRFCQDIKEVGFKYQMNDVMASLGRSNLKHVDWMLGLQRENIDYYNQALESLRVAVPPGANPNGWVYPIRIRRGRRWVEDEMAKHFDVDMNPLHTRNDIHSCVQDYVTSLPNMAILDRELTCIPSGWWIREREREYIASGLKKILGEI